MLYHLLILIVLGASILSMILVMAIRKQTKNLAINGRERSTPFSRMTAVHDFQEEE